MFRMSDQKCQEEIVPLESLEELLAWRECGVAEVCGVRPLVVRGCCADQCGDTCPTPHPRTLLCHDMKGGYLDDRFYKGNTNSDAYRFYNWHGVDSFVYFSHRFISVPPPGWINAAHLHGVAVLGTLITEWDNGADLCKKMLADEHTVKRAVSQLVKIAKHHCFEGWLINIENKIEPEQVEMLVQFVDLLRSEMRGWRHDSLVIWYDSVTRDGELKWQNELNEFNRCFFEVSDGIFLNYTWTVEGLERSRAAAGRRRHHVYVGLDVFGRNFYEGGKFNTHKALKEARDKDLSVAIFAQGWTYETQPDFPAAEEKLWRSLAPFLHTHGPAELPFETSFCQGFGARRFLKGAVVGEGSWHNLALQHHQPPWTKGEGRLSVDTSTAFSGGGCVRAEAPAPTSFRLVECRIPLGGRVVVALTWQWAGEGVPLQVLLLLRRGTNDTREVRVCVAGDAGHSDGATVTDFNTRLVNGWTQASAVVGGVGGDTLVGVSVWVGGQATLRIGHLALTH